MSDLVPRDSIEQIVGVPRHATEHIGRFDSDEQRVYILHSRRCLDSGIDLRECEYSVAMDEGVFLTEDELDTPMLLEIRRGALGGKRRWKESDNVT